MKRFLFLLCIPVLSCSSQVQIELIDNNLFVDSKKITNSSKIEYFVHALNSNKLFYVDSEELNSNLDEALMNQFNYSSEVYEYDLQTKISTRLFATNDTVLFKKIEPIVAIHISPDEELLYVTLSTKYGGGGNSSNIYEYNRQTKKIRFLFDGYIIKIINSGTYKNHFIVQLNLFRNSPCHGRVFDFYLFSPEGANIGCIGYQQSFDEMKVEDIPTDNFSFISNPLQCPEEVILDTLYSRAKTGINLIREFNNNIDEDIFKRIGENHKIFSTYFDSIECNEDEFEEFQKPKWQIIYQYINDKSVYNSAIETISIHLSEFQAWFLDTTQISFVYKVNLRNTSNQAFINVDFSKANVKIALENQTIFKTVSIYSENFNTIWYPNETRTYEFVFIAGDPLYSIHFRDRYSSFKSADLQIPYEFKLANGKQLDGFIANKTILPEYRKFITSLNQ